MRVAAAKPGANDKLARLLEEVEAIEKAVKTETLVASKPEAKKLSEELSGVLTGLGHIQTFSDSILKKFEWRTTEAAKVVTELFKSIKTEAVGQISKIKSGSLSEASAARTDCDRLAKRFVEAVGHVKADLSVNKEVFAKLVAHLKDVK